MARVTRPCHSLERRLLQLYQQAVAEKQFNVAEHILCALERMAARTPALKGTVDEAYLFIIHDGHSKSSEFDGSADTTPPEEIQRKREASRRGERHGIRWEGDVVRRKPVRRI